MKKRFVALMIAFALILPAGVQAAYASSADISAMLTDKIVYHTEESDYIAGDCVLTATRMMIRRSAIMNSSDSWSDITNALLRTEATVDGLLLSSFSFSCDGITYRISTGSFRGEDSAARIREFEDLLKKHPEGIVVHGEGAADSGTHGVLVVKVEDGEVYAVDSSNNTGDINKGIQKWSDTTMLDPSLCTDYWYIKDVSVEGGRREEATPELPRLQQLIPGLRLI